MLKSGDLSSVCSMVQDLRTICNHSSLVYPALLQPSSSSVKSTAAAEDNGAPAAASCHHHHHLAEVSPHPPRALSRLLRESPLDSVSMDNMNLVFLKQELSTTGN